MFLLVLSVQGSWLGSYEYVLVMRATSGRARVCASDACDLRPRKSMCW